MIRIWAKVLKNDKIVKQFSFIKDGDIDYSEFFSYLKTICETLDIPTPILIKSHLFYFAKYNGRRFKADDFVESINFDKLVLENMFDK